MTEPHVQTETEAVIDAAAEQLKEMANTFTDLGRTVAARWLGVTRSAVEATATTLEATSEVIASVSDAMSTLMDRVEKSSQR